MDNVDRKQFFYKNHIILYKLPENQNYTEYPWGRVYDTKVSGFIDLFRYNYKIISVRHLLWHIYAIRYMNPNMSESLADSVILHLINPSHGFIAKDIFEGSKDYERNFDYVKYRAKRLYLDDEPISKPRKVVFYSNSGLTVSEKLSIVGKFSGKDKRISESAIYEAMIMIHYDYSDKITIKGLAEMLGCTTRTIHRNLNKELKREKVILNSEL